MGVDVRLTYLTSSYKDFNPIEARLKELGVRYVGDGFCPTCEYRIDRLQRLAADGIRPTWALATSPAERPRSTPGCR